ncbi:MAG: hypothetical protein KME31_29855 [Tolypothrix carrinoi HA7290-LM1]|jgi:hypothetical protein|nr:hypothetical protein [Tolypothrix carrinoi HA7290-LM1]
MIEQVWESYTLEKIGCGINSGSIDPRELVEYFLTKIDQEIETGLTQLAQAMARLRRAERLKTKL